MVGWFPWESWLIPMRRLVEFPWGPFNPDIVEVDNFHLLSNWVEKFFSPRKLTVKSLTKKTAPILKARKQHKNQFNPDSSGFFVFFLARKKKPSVKPSLKTDAAGANGVSNTMLGGDSRQNLWMNSPCFKKKIHRIYPVSQEARKQMKGFFTDSLLQMFFVILVVTIASWGAEG